MVLKGKFKRENGGIHRDVVMTDREWREEVVEWEDKVVANYEQGVMVLGKLVCHKKGKKGRLMSVIECPHPTPSSITGCFPPKTGSNLTTLVTFTLRPLLPHPAA